MSNSQLCFLIANLWLMMPVIGNPSDAEAARVVYFIIGAIFIILSLATREWKKKPDQNEDKQTQAAVSPTKKK